MKELLFTESYPNEQQSCFITLTEFNTIQTNMTYEEIKNIVGCEGTLMSETEINEYTSKIYYWYGKDNISNANFTFQNNKLISKAQYGLR